MLAPHQWKSFQEGIMVSHGRQLTEAIQNEGIGRKFVLGRELIAETFSQSDQLSLSNHHDVLSNSLLQHLGHQNSTFNRSAVRIKNEEEDVFNASKIIQGGQLSYHLSFSPRVQRETNHECNVMQDFAHDSSLQDVKTQFSNVNTVFADWYANSSYKPSSLEFPFEFEPRSSLFMSAYEHPILSHQNPPTPLMNSTASWAEDRNVPDSQSWSCVETRSELLDSERKKHGRPRKKKACEHLKQKISDRLHQKMRDKLKRDNIREQFRALVSLINPIPTKLDRISIVDAAINCIVDLQKTIEELQERLKRKQGEGESNKRSKLEEEGSHDSSSSQKYHIMDQDFEQEQVTFDKSPCCSWFQITSKDGTHVETSVVNDEVNINLAQKSKASCLSLVSKILDKHNLRILHVNGAKFGDYSVFMFNAKISESYCVQAREIANELIEAADGHCSQYC